MTKRRKDILKRKYIAPEVYFEQTEPWEMIAASAEYPPMQSEEVDDHDPFKDLFPENTPSKQNYIPFFNDEEYENLSNE